MNQFRAAPSAEGQIMKLWSRIAQWGPLRRPVVKYSLITLAAGLWGVGLVDQLYSSAGAMKYLLMSLLIVAIAVI
jgi:hypothetical protein